ncbi:MAG: MarR family transcriptional regulator [Methanobrevibacter sp.]|jgi:DNA-binding MarR family transcriptional regulator|nr:MarR family transcriptional regulator [Candidatus Methanoflexus mossambicus]
MVAIRMIKKIQGKDKIKELEQEYKNINNLKRILESDQGNMLHELDLENWEYYLENPEEYLEEGKTIFIDGINLGETELELMHHIKKQNPKSVSELANIVNKKVSTIATKVNNLEKEGLISFKYGSKNRKIPIINYDKIEIAI